jgi:hypothetical protein
VDPAHPRAGEPPSGPDGVNPIPVELPSRRNSERSMKNGAFIFVTVFLLLSLLVVGFLALAEAGRLGRTRTQAMDVRARLSRVEQRISELRESLFDPRDVALRIAPSVVTLFTRVGLGTGFVVRTQGDEAWIATNFHVVSTRRGLV